MRSKIAILTVCIVSALGIAGIASASTSSNTSASNNAAFVVNHGTQVGDNCTASVDSIGWFGVGYITHFVHTSSGNDNIGCQLWGPPVANVMDFNGLRIDPSGHATLAENGS